MKIPSHAISSPHISFPFPPSAKLVVAVLSDFQCLKTCLRLPFCLPRSGKPVLCPQYIWNLTFCICPTHTSIPRLRVGSDTNCPGRRLPLPSSICFSLQARISIEVIILPCCLFFWGELNVKWQPSVLFLWCFLSNKTQGRSFAMSKFSTTSTSFSCIGFVIWRRKNRLFLLYLARWYVMDFHHLTLFIPIFIYHLSNALNRFCASRYMIARRIS